MKSCWGITDGSAGMVAQVKALALATDLPADMKVVKLKKIFGFLPNIIYSGRYNPLRRLFLPYILESSQILKEERPDIIISCGRRAALVAILIKNISPKTKTICIQDPQISAKNFDVVLAMRHDKIKGANVVKTLFALHSITPELLKDAALKFTPRFSSYRRPYLAVLIGGSTNKYKLNMETMRKFIEDLKLLHAKKSGSMLITPSRRTGKENVDMLKAEFSGNNNVYIYDGIEENPYMGMLALADEIAVSNDSVNMMTEAFATSKPVNIVEFAGHKNTKPARFAEMIKDHPPLMGDEMRNIADEVIKKLEN
ncbi:MAG: mitochondrial fission ELM1 family protein [Rickettsiales bacterium]